MMTNFNHDNNLPNTKTEYLSQTSTRSESYSKPSVLNRRLKREGHEANASPSSSSRRGRDRRIIAPSRRDKELLRQVSGSDLYDDFDRAEPGGIVEEGAIIIEGGKVIGGMIAPTHRQRQLMRQVSGLGLEDPVFGKNVCLDDSITKEHASFFFDDMDINDIPEDMRDMVSLASDRTDKVEADDLQSYDSKSFASLPPLGLEDALPTTKKIRRGKKPRRKSKDMSTCQSITSDPHYVPPAPVFETRSRRRCSNDGERRGSMGSMPAVDNALAAQVDALLSLHESKNSINFSSHSRGSYTGHSRTSYTGQSRPLKKGTRPKPSRQGSRRSVASNTAYVPPSLHSDGPSQRGERYMPESMDDIFSSKTPSKRVKKKKMEEKKKKKKSKDKPLKTKAPRDADWVVS